MDLTAANQYFNTRLNADAWDGATDTNKTKALATAERHLQQYKDRVDAARFSYAIYEQALFLLQMTDFDRERQRTQVLGIVGGSVGRVSEYSSADIVRQRMSGVTICPEALSYLRGPGIKAGGLR